MPRLIRILTWSAVAVLGACAVAVAAFQRDEPVNALWLVVAGVCTFAVSYRFYSAWLMAKVLTIDPTRAPAAVTRADGKDFVPTPRWMVFGHHFAAIAGPGPLVGPVLAAQFGYLPGTLWILIGATLGGGVHDSVVLFASMRRDGKSLGQMLKEEINPFIGIVAMISLLAIMTILLAVLGLVVVKALAESPWGLFTIAATIPLAMVMGLLLKSGALRVTGVSVIGVAGLLLAVVAGKYLPDSWNQALRLDAPTLAWVIMIYGFAASVLPVWLLLAPRDYLSTFMKLGTVAVLGHVHRHRHAAAAHAGGDPIHRWQRLRGAGTGVPVCLHHHRLWGRERLPLADCLGHHPEVAGPGKGHPPRRLWRDGHRDVSGADGHHCRQRPAARPIPGHQFPHQPARSGGRRSPDPKNQRLRPDLSGDRRRNGKAGG